MLIVALIARRLVPDAHHVGTWAALFAALDPMLVVYSGVLLSETLFTAVFVVHLYVLLSVLDDPRSGMVRPAGAGLLAAAATFVRPISYFWPFVAAAFLAAAGRRQHRSRVCLAFLVAALLPCVAWQVRNAVQTGYTGFSATSAYNLYYLNAAGTLARIEGVPFDEVRTRLNARVRNLDTQAERAGYMRREGLRIVLTNPVTSLGVHLQGAARVLLDPGATRWRKLYGGQSLGLVAQTFDLGMWSTFMRLWRDHHPTLAILTLVLAPILLAQLAGAVLGVFRCWSQRTAAVLVLLGVVAYFLAVSGGPLAQSRFRHPIMPVVCVLMAAGISKRG